MSVLAIRSRFFFFVAFLQLGLLTTSFAASYYDNPQPMPENPIVLPPDEPCLGKKSEVDLLDIKLRPLTEYRDRWQALQDAAKQNLENARKALENAKTQLARWEAMIPVNMREVRDRESQIYYWRYEANEHQPQLIAFYTKEIADDQKTIDDFNKQIAAIKEARDEAMQIYIQCLNLVHA
jgi:uncharacterized protein YhaN